MSLSNAQKAAVAAVGLLGAILALVIPGYDLNFTQTVVALVGPVFGVIGVFVAKNHTPEDLGKALAALQAAALAVAGYFVEVPASTGMKITVLIGAVVAVVAVWWIPNSNYTYTLTTGE
jgi:hypothetical protein